MDLGIERLLTQFHSELCFEIVLVDFLIKKWSLNNKSSNKETNNECREESSNQNYFPIFQHLFLLNILLVFFFMRESKFCFGKARLLLVHQPDRVEILSCDLKTEGRPAQPFGPPSVMFCVKPAPFAVVTDPKRSPNRTCSSHRGDGVDPSRTIFLALHVQYFLMTANVITITLLILSFC